MTDAFLDGYDGQSLDELLALQATHRIDSLVLALEQALLAKPAADLSPPERVVLAVEALEREVNNGGYHQFFFNASVEHAGDIVAALQAIGCPQVAAITADALAAAALPAGASPEALERHVADLDDAARARLAECDGRFFSAEEPIAERLFAYVVRERAHFTLPG